MPDYTAPTSGTEKIVTDEFAHEVRRRVQQGELGGIRIEVSGGNVRIDSRDERRFIANANLLGDGDVLESVVPLDALYVQADGSSTVTVRVNEQPWTYAEENGVSQQ